MKGANNSTGDQMIKLVINKIKSFFLKIKNNLKKKAQPEKLIGRNSIYFLVKPIGDPPVMPADIQPACQFFIFFQDPYVHRLHCKREIKGVCL